MREDAARVAATQPEKTRKLRREVQVGHEDAARGCEDAAWADAAAAAAADARRQWGAGALSRPRAESTRQRAPRTPHAICIYECIVGLLRRYEYIRDFSSSVGGQHESERAERRARGSVSGSRDHQHGERQPTVRERGTLSRRSPASS